MRVSGEKLPYVVTYRMWSGAARRELMSAAETVMACREIQAAGGAILSIADASGCACTLDELIVGHLGSHSRKSGAEPKPE